MAAEYRVNGEMVDKSTYDAAHARATASGVSGAEKGKANNFNNGFAPTNGKNNPSNPSTNEMTGTNNESEAGGYQTDDRVRLSLSPGAGSILYRAPGILQPLSATNGMIFPYTPAINVTHSAEYDTQGLVHTNYAQHSYMRSNVEQIQVTGTFTAETQEEARYLLACIHFLKSVTKMFYGQDENRGTPPPVLRFSAHGVHMYNSLPVVVTTTNFDFPQDVDYINVDVQDSPSSTGGSGVTTRVPTAMLLNATMLVMQSRTRTLDFSLNKYAAGEFLGNGNKGTFA